MLKWLFCQHEYIAIDKYYYITDEDCRNIIYAIKVKQCTLCNNTYEDEVLRFTEIDNRLKSLQYCIQKLENKGYQCEIDYRLNKF